MAGEYYFRKNVLEDESINYPSTNIIAALPFKLKVIENWENPAIICLVEKYNNLIEQLGIPKNFN